MNYKELIYKIKFKQLKFNFKGLKYYFLVQNKSNANGSKCMINFKIN